MKKFRSLVLTALGLLAFSPAAAYAETGRIVGHFDGADFELRMDAQKETSGVDFDFFQQSGRERIVEDDLVNCIFEAPSYRRQMMERELRA